MLVSRYLTILKYIDRVQGVSTLCLVVHIAIHYLSGSLHIIRVKTIGVAAVYRPIVTISRWMFPLLSLWTSRQNPTNPTRRLLLMPNVDSLKDIILLLDVLVMRPVNAARSRPT